MDRESKFNGVVPRGGGFSMPDYWVWCGSPIVGDDGRYHLFASRWPKTLPFHPGWLTSSEIVRASADAPAGPYRFEEVVLPARGAEYWDGRMSHNPAVVKAGDQYVLYYTGSTHPFDDVTPDAPPTLDNPRVIVARSNKRVGCATARSVLGPWTRSDAPILPTHPDTFYSFLTSNPTPCVRPDGGVLLIFKARAYEGHTNGGMTLAAAVADEVGGRYRVVRGEPLVSRGAGGELEDPCVWWQDGRYHLIAKDMTGDICGEKGAGAYATSTDGLEWSWATGTKAYSRDITWDDGSRQTLGSFERPAMLLEQGVPTHLFAAVADGPGGFTRASNTWNLALPLVVG